MLRLAIVAAVLAVGLSAPSIKSWLENGRPQRVPAGVHLVETPVGGMKEAELRAVVHQLARRIDQAPVNARWDERSGRLWPDQPGLAVDIDATMSACLKARKGSRVDPVLTTLPASIRATLFEEVSRGDPNRAVVALMFNVAWGEEYLDRILDQLEQNGARSTFFFDGAWVEKFRGRVRAIADRGQEIANHGYRHDHILELPEHEVKNLIQKNEDLLRSVTGREPARLFAPPYGERNALTIRAAAELGYYTVMWTIDTLDWRHPPPEEIAEKVLSRVKNGALVLMHPTEQTVKALDLLLPELRAKGFQLVTVSEAIEPDAPIAGSVAR